MKAFRQYNLIFWAGILLAQIFFFYTASQNDAFIFFFEYFFEKQKYAHQWLFHYFPFSVGDLFYIILGCFLVYTFASLHHHNKRRNAMRRLLVVFNFLYFIYQIFWGMLYFQKPLIQELPREDISLEEVKLLTLKYLEQCQRSRNMVKENTIGVFKLSDTITLKQEILKSQTHLPFSKKKHTGIRSIKPSLFGKVMNYSGILGYYNPFTAEAQYNSNLPATFIPFTIAHETAHQLGFAREEEANFIAYIIGTNSYNKDLKYSTDFFVLKSLINYASLKDETFAQNIINKFTPGMLRDRNHEWKFQKTYKGTLEQFFQTTNDWFLKSNQQDGSISYSYFTELLIRYERTKTKKNRTLRYDSKNTNDEKKFIAPS